MSVTFNPATGFPVKPPQITRYYYVVRGFYGDGLQRIEANSPEELDALYEAGHARKEWGWIYDGGTRLGYDPDAMKDYDRALHRIFQTSCVMPPVEDLQLLSRAKQLAPDEWDQIDPQAGQWPETRRVLREIQNDLKYRRREAQAYYTR